MLLFLGREEWKIGCGGRFTTRLEYWVISVLAYSAVPWAGNTTSSDLYWQCTVILNKYRNEIF